MKFRTSALVTLAIATVMFGFAIAIRHDFNPWISNLVAALVSIVLALVIMRSRLRKLLAIHRHGLLGAAALGSVMVAMTHIGYRAVGALVPEIQVTVSHLYQDIQLTAPPLYLMVPLIGFIVAAEELVWRGLAFGVLETRLSTWELVAATTLLYAAPQFIGGSWILIAAAIAVGSVFGVQRALTGRLSDSLVTHAIWSICVFGLIPL